MTKTGYNAQIESEHQLANQRITIQPVANGGRDFKEKNGRLSYTQTEFDFYNSILLVTLALQQE